MTSRPLSRLLTAFLCACAVLGVSALAACAGQQPSAQTGANGETGTVTLGFSAWPGWFPWQVAQEQGLFAKNGLNVDLRYFDSYTDSITALSSGVIDANSQTLNDTIASMSGGANAQGHSGQ